MKKALVILILCFTAYYSTAQTDTGLVPTPPPQAPVRPRIVTKPKPRRVAPDTAQRRILSDSARVADSVLKADSLTTAIAGVPDSTNRLTASPLMPVPKKPIDSFYLKLLDNPFFRTKAKPIYLVINERQPQLKDEIFYLLMGLLLFLAFIKLVFAKYFQNIFRLFFQPTFRQKQTREQLAQGALPSLLLNLFFIFSTAAYASFLLEYHNFTTLSFWLTLIYSTIALLVLYLGKYIFLTFAGWVFNVKEATETYIFVVYLINKILGVVLFPFILLIAFSKPNLVNVAVTVSILIICILFVYRFLVSYAPVRKEVKVSPFHFLLYIFAFEITPLLLIYKTLIIYLNKSL